MSRSRASRGSSTRQSVGSSLNSRTSNTFKGTAKGSAKPRGQFIDRIWHCDCHPRLPAEHFKVKKEGPNKGRWFYTCQKAQEERCGFFLWDEDAEPRMQAALMHGGGSEVDTSPAIAQNNPGAQPSYAAQPVQSKSAPHQAHLISNSNPRKRTLPWANERDGDDSSTDDEALPWPSTANDHQMIQDPNSRNSNVSPPPLSTPRKAQKTSLEATPASHLREEIGLATPHTCTRNGRFTNASIKVEPGPQTPTPTRFHDISTSATTTPSKAGEDITSTVLSYLQCCRTTLSPDHKAGLRAILETHNHQVRGFIKGRDVAREAVKSKDAKIADLTTRIEALESDLELYRLRVKSLKSEKDVLSSQTQSQGHDMEL